MKNNNYKEKEKILNDTLDKLGTMSTRVSPMENDNSQLSLHKNQLISEKEEVEQKYQELLKDYRSLQFQFEKIKKKIQIKLDNQSKVNEKIDELNQETEGLIGEIDKW
tara:strand:+ start:123 stop:446 length:324 start_codon:yes stop_codon:yes gene_type:complete